MVAGSESGREHCFLRGIVLFWAGSAGFLIKRSRLKGRGEERRNRGEKRKGSDALTYSISKQT